MSKKPPAPRVGRPRDPNPRRNLVTLRLTDAQIAIVDRDVAARDDGATRQVVLRDIVLRSLAKRDVVQRAFGRRRKAAP